MSFSPAIILSTLFLKNRNGSSSPLFQYLSGDGGVVNCRHSELVSAISREEQNLPKGDDCSNITLNVFDLEDFPRAGTILFPSGFKDCIHGDGFDSVMTGQN